MDRSCGDCTLCCTLLYIAELSKPAQERCEHVCDSGCSIYQTRPHSCRRFECLWLKGQVPDWARPDKIGVIFDELRPKVTGMTMPLVVFESLPGVHKQPLVLPLLNELGQGRETLLVRPDGYAKTFDLETL